MNIKIQPMDLNKSFTAQKQQQQKSESPLDFEMLIDCFNCKTNKDNEISHWILNEFVIRFFIQTRRSSHYLDSAEKELGC
jgi:hypothetical protein